MTVAQSCIAIGRAVEREYQAQELAAPDQSLFDRRMESARLGKHSLSGKMGLRAQEATLTRLWRTEIDRRRENDIAVLPAWPQSLRARLGAHLLAALLQTARVNRSATTSRAEVGGEITEHELCELFIVYFYLR